MENELKNQLIIGLVGVIVILCVVSIWEAYDNQYLATQSDNVLKQIIPLNLVLIQHLNCDELKEWKTHLLLDNTDIQTDLNKQLTDAVNKAMNDRLC